MFARGTACKIGHYIGGVHMHLLFGLPLHLDRILPLFGVSLVSQELGLNLNPKTRGRQGGFSEPYTITLRLTYIDMSIDFTVKSGGLYVSMEDLL